MPDEAKVELVSLPDGSLYDKSKYSVRYGRLSDHERDLSEYSVYAADKRTGTEKDRGRVSYSSFLRRLSGVTQVISPDLHQSHLHSRESHSVKVSLVSREIAEHLVRMSLSNTSARRAIELNGGLDITACQTAGLAHDLGHPPFGHGGEVALHRGLVKKEVYEGFEGNAQTFRIVTVLDRRGLNESSSFGLDLTRVTLAAILKYPRAFPDDAKPGGPGAEKASEKPPKYGTYEVDADNFETVASKLCPRSEDGLGYVQTLEAAIMDLADDITYACHDLEDFYYQSSIDFAQVSQDLRTAITDLEEMEVPGSIEDQNKRKASTNAFVRIVDTLHSDYQEYFKLGAYRSALSDARRYIDLGFRSAYEGSPLQAARPSSVLSEVIESFFKGLELTPSREWKDGPFVRLQEKPWHLLQVLKTVTKRYVVGTPRIGAIEHAQSRAIGRLFDETWNWINGQPRRSELPAALAAYLPGSVADRDARLELEGVPNSVTLRAVADYICSLSDEAAYDRSRWFSGLAIPSMNDRP